MIWDGGWLFGCSQDSHRLGFQPVKDWLDVSTSRADTFHSSTDPANARNGRDIFLLEEFAGCVSISFWILM